MAPLQNIFEGIDEATVRLIIATELQEADSLTQSDTNSLDLSMARRIHTDQLLEYQSIHGIERTTPAEPAIATRDAPIEAVGGPPQSLLVGAIEPHHEEQTPIPSPPANPEFLCVSCEDSLPSHGVWQAPCQHHICIECLEKLHHAAMTDPTLYPPKCCVILPWNEVKSVISAELATAFEKKKEELDTNEGERTYCSQQTCSHFLGANAVSGGIANCPACHTATCVACKTPSHTGPCSEGGDEALQQTMSLARDEGWQKCNACQRVIDLMLGGCRHITCLCGHEFCYACGAVWKTCTCLAWVHAHPFDIPMEQARNNGRPPVAAMREHLGTLLMHLDENLGEMLAAQRGFAQEREDDEQHQRIHDTMVKNSEQLQRLRDDMGERLRQIDIRLSLRERNARNREVAP